MQLGFPFISRRFILIVGISAFAPQSVLTMAIVSPTHGPNPALSCKLMHHKKVIQVTWKKITLNSTENVATYSRFGAIIAKPFQDHVQFLEAGLHKSSLLIKGLERDNKACYSCTFYSYPNGAASSTACLNVYELNKPVPEVRETFSWDGRILHTLTCREKHTSIFPRHADADNPVESSVGSFDPSLDFPVSVIKVAVTGGKDLTCVQRAPPVGNRKDVSTIKGEPRMMFLSNRSGRLSPTLCFMILATGLGIYNI